MRRKLIFCMLALTALALSGCTQKSNQGNQNSTPNSTTNSTSLSEDEAKQIALSHAELTTDQVTFIRSNIEREDGREVYDVEFYTQDQKEYDYEIEPYTGEILDYDYDAENRY